MKGDTVPDDNHVSRLCGGSHIDDGVVQAGAFLLAAGHTYLSVNWLEHLGLKDRASEIAEIRCVLATKRRIGATARIGVAHVGNMRRLVRSESEDARELRVLHEPEENPSRPDPSHSGVHNLRHDDLMIAVILSRAFSETYSARADVSQRSDC